MPFQKGHPGYKKKGTKNRATILKEKARDEYERLILSEFGTIVKIQKEAAKDRDNVQERQYVINQIIGKPVERVEVSGELEFNFDAES